MQQGGRLLRGHTERCASGTPSRARAEMTSVTTECREVRLGIVTEDVALFQRCRRHKRQILSPEQGRRWEQQHLCELFPAINLESDE